MNEPRRVVFLTGASSGLGRALALRFAEPGTSLALFARRREALEAVAAAAVARGAEALAYPVDVSDADALHTAFDAALARFGAVTVLVNAAGWSPPLRPVLETPVETWDKVMAVNARATYLTSRHCLPILLKQGGGMIVNICTAAEPLKVPTISAYRASKAAQRAFAQCLREELKGTGVKVLTVLPEPMDTPMRWEATPDFPRDKVISPDDVAATIHALVTGPAGVSVDEVFVRLP